MNHKNKLQQQSNGERTSIELESLPFCRAQNSTTEQKCPPRQGKCNERGNISHYAEVCKTKQMNIIERTKRNDLWTKIDGSYFDRQSKN